MFGNRTIDARPYYLARRRILNSSDGFLGSGPDTTIDGYALPTMRIHLLPAEKFFDRIFKVQYCFTYTNLNFHKYVNFSTSKIRIIKQILKAIHLAVFLFLLHLKIYPTLLLNVKVLMTKMKKLIS